jgi:hypothetical protein
MVTPKVQEQAPRAILPDADLAHGGPETADLGDLPLPPFLNDGWVRPGGVEGQGAAASESQEDTVASEARKIAEPDISTVNGLSDQLQMVYVTKEELLRFFERVRPQIFVRHRLTDEISGLPERIIDVHYDDGTWEWHERLAYYVEHYNVCLPDEFLHHLLASAFDLDLVITAAS